MKILVIAAATMLLCTGAYAQDKSKSDMNKEVEVTKEYMPDVNRATKLSISPRMIDTVTLRPEIDYSIRPTPWLGSFGVAAINPIKVKTVEFMPTSPFYLKAGLGFPLNSVVDFYATGGNGKTNAYGIALNHSGEFNKITNTIDERLKADRTNNHIGVFGLHNNSKRFWIGGQIGYDYDMYTPYGGFEMPLINERVSGKDQERNTYNTPTASIWLGNNFRDMSQFNIRGFADGYYFKNNKDAGEVGYKFGIEIGKAFNTVHDLRLKVALDGYKGADSVSDYSNTITTISPRYTINLSKFKFQAGVDAVYDNPTEGDAKLWIYPQIDLTLNLISDYIVPFVSATGKLTNNGVRNSTLRNPYVMSGVFNKNTSEYNIKAGISGTLAPQFAYRFSIGAIILRDYNAMNYTCLQYTDSRNIGFAPFTIPKSSIFTIGAEVDGRFTSKFSYWVAAHYYSKSVSDREELNLLEDDILGIPDYDMSIGLKYNYQDKFRVKVGATLFGKRTAVDHYLYFNEYTASENPNNSEVIKMGYSFYTIDPVVDINASVETKVSRMTTVFLEAHNIASSKLFVYPQYPSVGFSCTLGVKLSF